jgi:hypothetical protein
MIPSQGYLIEECLSLSDWCCSLRADFKCLQYEVSEQTRLLPELSKDVQEVVLSSFLSMLYEGDRNVLHDLMKMVRVP